MTKTNSARASAKYGVVAVLGILAVLLAGCTGLGNVSGHLAGLTTKPKVGDCWTTTFTQSQKTEDWEGTQPVSCSKSHQTYTYAVVKLGKHFGYKSWLTSTGEIRTDVDRSAHDACIAAQARILPDVTVKEALLVPTYYVPSVAMWGAGARWVRCDIGEIKVGSLVSAPKFANLDAFATLQSTLKNDPTRYALCENDPANNGPDGAETTYADCKRPADYTFLAQLTMEGALGSAYPGVDALTEVGKKQCATLKVPAGHDVIAEPPAELNWTKYGDRQLDCWLNNN